MGFADRAITRRDLVVETPADYAALGRALDDLEKGSYLCDIDETEVADPRRIKIARTYLVLLGYLRNDNAREKVDQELRAAIRRFQKDAELAVNENLDIGTWRRLAELARFDLDHKPDFDDNTGFGWWFKEDEIKPPLERAVRLRLFSYGVLATPPSHVTLTPIKRAKADRALHAALVDFVRVTALLGLAVPGVLLPTLNRETLALLFDHVGIISGVRQRDKDIAVSNDDPRYPLDRVQRRRLVAGFIENLALVELWLLGYSVRPGNFKPEGKNGREADDSLRGALGRFAKDRGIPRRNGRKPPLGFWFFAEARSLHGEPDESEALDEAILEPIIHDKKQMRALAREYRSIGARIVDGVNRAARWVAHLFRKIVKVVRTVLGNVARVLNKAALAAYDTLRKAMGTLSTGFEYLFSREVKGSDSDSVVILKQGDFDMDIVINADAAPAIVSSFFDVLKMRVCAMVLGARMILQLLEAVSIVVVAATATVAWLALIIALARLARWLSGAAELAREMSELSEELDRLDRVVGPSPAG